MYYFYAFLFILTVNLIDFSHSWGEIGHRSTASIAINFLNENAVKHIDQILSKYTGPDGKTFKSIAEIATYPDEIRPYVPWASTYHYVNMKKGETAYNEATQCESPRYCIVRALQNYTSTLKDPSIRDNSRLGEALSFTTHFMGDFFQPLHAGNVEDVGATKINVTFSDDWDIDEKSSDLHWTWDHLILLHWKNDEIKTDLNGIYRYYVRRIEGNPEFRDYYLTRAVNFVQIANETRVYAIKDVYDKLSKYNLDRLSISYYVDNIDIIHEQVMKSGLQMARILNDIFDEREINGASASLKSALFSIILSFSCFIFFQNY